MSWRRLLFIYPDFEPTYWGMQHALPLVGRKSFMPPLGLMTIAAMTPAPYEVRILDMNCEALTDESIEWADLILFSAMMMQHGQLFAAADRCRRARKPVAIGGPYATSFPDECRAHSDFLILNEGEITWPLFLADLEAGTLKDVYSSNEKPDITKTPCPRFDLVNMAAYASVPLQYSRGCPFQCEFCDITVLYGRAPRTKTPEQMLGELDAVYATGYRGGVFIVDDNFIGNKREVIKFLPALERWNREHGYPFQYGTEASLNLADDRKLLEALVRAGFLWVFVGIETPSTEALKEVRKLQNVGASILDRIRLLQRAGLLIFGGFILGFDSDTTDIFDRQIDFIRDAAIPNALIGQLGALPGTQLYSRLQREGRLLHSLTDRSGFGPFYSNFATRLPFKIILEGQSRILQTIYEPRAFFDRLAEAYRRLPRKRAFLLRIRGLLPISRSGSTTLTRKQTKVLRQFSNKARLAAFWHFLKSVDAGYRREAIRFMRFMLLRRPEYFEQALEYVVVGYHYHRFTSESAVPEYQRILAKVREMELLLPAVCN